MQLRHAHPGRDGPACAEIYAPYVRDTVISLEERPPTAEEMTGRIERVIARFPWIVADDDGVVAGYAYAGEHRERASYRWASDVTVYVAGTHHRRGLGSALYSALFELLARQGVYVLCAGVTLPNAASVGLHESLGFSPVGVYENVAWKFGSWWDVGWWQRQLVPPSDGPPEELGPPAQLD